MSKRGELEPQHWRYIQLRLMGNTNGECASELHVDQATCWRWGQNPLVRDELAKLQADACESSVRIVKAGLQRAARKVVDLVDSEDENVALRAATFLLERQAPVAEDIPLREVASTGDPWDGE